MKPRLILALFGAIAACSSSDGALFGDPASDGGDSSSPAPGPDAQAQNDATTAAPDADGDDGAPPDTRKDGGKDGSARDTGTDTGGGSDASSSDAAADAGVDCGAPYKIFTTDAGPFCPFTAAGPARCATSEHCCEYVADSGLPSTCNGANAACVASPGVIDWGCDEANDCPADEVCCFVGAIVQDRPECPLYRGANVSGTVCRPGACNAGEAVVCGSQADCANGTCTGMNMRGKDLGFCK
jgi:hypothetical protein